MLVAAAVVVTLVVVLSGNEGGEASPIEGPDAPTTYIPPPPTEATTISTTEGLLPTTEGPSTELPPSQLELQDVIDGLYSAPIFNASWSSGMLSYCLFSSEFI